MVFNFIVLGELTYFEKVFEETVLDLLVFLGNTYKVKKDEARVRDFRKEVAIVVLVKVVLVMDNI